jgi:hypothetical protein
MKHVLIIRTNYKDDDKFYSRLSIMKNTCIESINNQTNKNFEIGLLCSDNHFQILKKLFLHNKVHKIKLPFLEFCQTNDFQIQTRLDNDDILDSDYIDKVQKIIRTSKLPVLIQTQPYKLHLKTNKLYKMALRYNKNRTSMFLTLAQDQILYTVQEKKHGDMWQIVPNVIDTEEGITKLVIHEENTLSKLHQNDQLIMGDITIVFLNWKRREYLESIIQKTKKQFYLPEIIVVDNSSSDSKNKINVTSDITYIGLDNSLKCWARWKQIENVNSKYFCVMDDDLIFENNDVLEKCKIYMDNNPKVDAVGYAGVINDSDNYWTCTHLNEPLEIDRKVDVIKGRFMFIRTNTLKNLNMTPDLTCDDIKVSSHLKNKVVLSKLKGKFTNLKEGDESLHSQIDQRQKRVDAMEKYFGKC